MPWPSPELWDYRTINYKNEATSQIQTVFVQSSLPPEFSGLPEWFRGRFTIVEDPQKADAWVFIRSGEYQGNSNPDILVTGPNGGGRIFLAITPNVPPTQQYNVCHQWPESESPACALANIGEAMKPAYHAPTNWEYLRTLVNAAPNRPLKIDSYEEDRAAMKAAAKKGGCYWRTVVSTKHGYKCPK